MKQRRKAAILVRVSEREKGLIQSHAVAVGLTLSAYVRHMALHEWDQVKAAARVRRTRALTVELKRIGTTLNQLTRKLNAGPAEALPDAAERISQPLIETLAEVQAAMRDVQRYARPRQTEQSTSAAGKDARTRREVNRRSKHDTTVDAYLALRLRFRAFFDESGPPETMSSEALIDLYELVTEHHRITEHLLQEPRSLSRLVPSPRFIEDLHRQADTFRLLRDRVNAFSLSELFTPYQYALDLTLALIRKLGDGHPMGHPMPACETAQQNTPYHDHQEQQREQVWRPGPLPYR